MREEQSGREYPKEFSRTIRTLSGGTEVSVRIRVTVDAAGDDLLLFIRGGREHIGSVVLTQSRASLRGDASMSCSSSVLNVTGHKDEEICRFLAEKTACASGRRVAAAGGIHIDGLSPAGIREVERAVKELSEEILAALA